MLDLHTLEHGYKEIYPPYMVKKEMLVGLRPVTQIHR